jgi:exopolysaccharide biosynthesis polyprenyl glycosylphosphotransferase
VKDPEMFSRHNRMIGVFYLCSDMLLALLSFWLAWEIRSYLITPRPLYSVSNYPWVVPLSAGIWILVGLLAGVYRDIKEEELRRAFTDPLKVALGATVALFAATYAVKFEYLSRLLLILYAGTNLVAATLFRLVARRYAGPLRRSLAGLRGFLLVGDGPEVIEIARTIEAHETHGMRLVGFVRTGASLPALLEQSPLRGSHPIFDLTQLPELLRRQVIDEVIFAITKEDLERLEEAFRVCEVEGVKSRVLLTFFPYEMSKVYLEHLGEKPLLTFATTPENEYLLLLKRVLDFVLALVLLVLLSPLMALLGLLIRLTSGSPVLFRQTRCGLGGRKFTLYKFRSMRPDADLGREELAALNEVDGPVFKITHDPRCTPIGRFMRKFSLDEFPQLLNIVKGDMSFVGPRPPLPEEVEKYERWQRRRLRMLPGLTCLWALEGRSRLSFRRWMELDLDYIDHWSLALDCKILLKTVPIVLLGRGAS